MAGICELSKLHISVIITTYGSRVEFLVEVAIYSILYIREVYPAELFVRRKKYDTPVYQSRHPGLNEYISGAIKAIFNELLQVSILCGFISSKI